MFHAHYNPITKAYQSNTAHSLETAHIALEKCADPSLENMLWLMGCFHDAGKYSDAWQEYFHQAIQCPEETRGPKMDHTTVGGQMIEEFAGGSLFSQLAQLVIYSHHGLQDCISPKDSTSLFQRRKEKVKQLPLEECRERFYQAHPRAEILKRWEAAQKECDALKNRIVETAHVWKNGGYGDTDFLLGLYVRYFLSLLIDADRRNTEDFMNGMQKEAFLPSAQEIQEIWALCKENVERKIASFPQDAAINACRKEISDQCRAMAERPQNRYFFTVPTGTGKTLSSLRFAIHHAAQFRKKRIIYVAPFQSIVEQNAQQIREALGNSEIVLEHHCNVILEAEEDQIRYDRITEDWALPVIVTTGVQFLNALFSGKTCDVRRMHSLCDSVVMMDEVQALPVRILKLLNVALNFLTELMNTTVVLCTATQPLLHKLGENRLLPAAELVREETFPREVLQRTEILDCTQLYPGGMNIEQAAEFVQAKSRRYQKILLIVNTKACARNLYLALKDLCGEDVKLHHLSTNMYPQHRIQVIDEIKQHLKLPEETQICVSTQLIEAGVDISFQCVIRSLAGLDSIIQSAGRCNRHKEAETGQVCIIRMNPEAENLSKLPEIREAQEAVGAVLSQFKKAPSCLAYRLDSNSAIHMYFDRYFSRCEAKMEYPVEVEGIPTSIMELLSQNAAFAKKGTRQAFKQAFKTAGEKFEVITDQGKVSLVIQKDCTEEMLSRLENEQISLKEKQQILRALQPYSVSISQTEQAQLRGWIDSRWDHRILMLHERFYDREIGLTPEPRPMQDLQI